MSSNTPNNDVQNELEGLSPLLARIREQKVNGVSEDTDLDTLHALGQAALAEVPANVQAVTAPVVTMEVVHRKRKWLGLVAAAFALMVGALITYSVYTNADSANGALAGTNAALTQELIASFEEQTSDPIAFLLDDETLFEEEDDLFFSPVEDVLLDWADDGSVEEALTEEDLLDALW